MAGNCDINSTDINFVNTNSSMLKLIRWLKFCKTLYVFECSLEDLQPPLADIPRMIALSTYDDCMSTRQLTAYCISMILSIGIIIANIIIIIAFIKNHELFTCSNLPILNLSLSDFLTGLTFLYSTSWNLVILTAGYKFDIANTMYFIEKRSNKYLCLTLDGPGLLFACMMSSVFSLGLIAAERYIAIFYPFRYHDWITMPRMVIGTIVLWVISFLVAILPLLGWSNWEGKCTLTEVIDYGYLVMWSIVCFFSGLIVLFIYIRIFILTRKHIRQIKAALVTISTSSTSIQDSVGKVSPSTTAPTGTREPKVTTGSSMIKGKGNILTTTVLIHNPSSSTNMSIPNAVTDSSNTNSNTVLTNQPNMYTEENENHHKTVSSQDKPTVSYNNESDKNLNSNDNCVIESADDSVKAEIFQYNAENLIHLKAKENNSTQKVVFNLSNRSDDKVTSIKPASEIVPPNSETINSNSQNEHNLKNTSTMDTSTGQLKATKSNSQEIISKRKSTVSMARGSMKYDNNRQQTKFKEKFKILKTRPNIKAITTTAMILGAFYVCWLPFLVFLLGFQDKYDQNLNLYYLAIVTQINSLFNPLLYGFRQAEIKRAVRSLCSRNNEPRNDI